MFDAKSLLDGLTKNIPSQLSDTLNSLGFGRTAAAEGQREGQPLKQVNDEADGLAAHEHIEAQLREGFNNVREGLSGAGEKAKGLWQNQSTLGKTAIAGGLLGVLFSSGGRKLVQAGGKLGVTALIGGLAYRAYQSWQAGNRPMSAEQAAQDVVPPPPESDFAPATREEANELAQRMLRAMVAAAKVDGHVDEAERARIGAELAKLGIGSEAEAMIAAELDAPLVIERIAALARSPAEASQIYAATLLVIDETSPEERAYLDRLAAALRLDPDLVRHLEASAAHLG